MKKLQLICPQCGYDKSRKLPKTKRFLTLEAIYKCKCCGCTFTERESRQKQQGLS